VACIAVDADDFLVKGFAGVDKHLKLKPAQDVWGKKKRVTAMELRELLVQDGLGLPLDMLQMLDSGLYAAEQAEGGALQD